MNIPSKNFRNFLEVVRIFFRLSLFFNYFLKNKIKKIFGRNYFFQTPIHPYFHPQKEFSKKSSPKIHEKMEKKNYDSPASLISTPVTWVFSPKSIIGGEGCLRGNKHRVHDEGRRKCLRATCVPPNFEALETGTGRPRQGFSSDDGAAPAKLRPVTPPAATGRKACVGTKSRCV